MKIGTHQMRLLRNSGSGPKCSFHRFVSPRFPALVLWCDQPQEQATRMYFGVLGLGVGR